MIVFPAHAGMNRIIARVNALPGRVPRARGDEPRGLVMPPSFPACSPRTRG